MKQNYLAKSLVFLLVVEYILGMLANFYSEIPSDKPDEVFRHFGFIFVHSAVAVLLIILSVMFLVRALKGKSRTVNARWGLIGIAIAFISGHLFVGNQSDIYSLIMSLGFIIAFGSYLYEVISFKPSKE